MCCVRWIAKVIFILLLTNIATPDHDHTFFFVIRPSLLVPHYLEKKKIVAKSSPLTLGRSDKSSRHNNLCKIRMAGGRLVAGQECASSSPMSSNRNDFHERSVVLIMRYSCLSVLSIAIRRVFVTPVHIALVSSQ